MLLKLFGTSTTLRYAQPSKVLACIEEPLNYRAHESLASFGCLNIHTLCLIIAKVLNQGQPLFLLLVIGSELNYFVSEGINHLARYLFELISINSIAISLVVIFYAILKVVFEDVGVWVVHEGLCQIPISYVEFSEMLFVI